MKPDADAFRLTGFSEISGDVAWSVDRKTRKVAARPEPYSRAGILIPRANEVPGRGLALDQIRMR